MNLTKRERRQWMKAIRRHLKLADRLEHTDPANFDMASWMSGIGSRHGMPATWSVDRLQEQYLEEWVRPYGPTVTDPLEFLRATDAGLDPSCGTTACLAGHTVLTWPKQAVALADTADHEGRIGLTAAAILGYEDGLPISIGALFDSSAPWRTPKEAARELRRRAQAILDELVAYDRVEGA